MKKLAVGVCAAVAAAVSQAELVDLTALVRAAGGEGVSYAVEQSSSHDSTMAAPKCFNGTIVQIDNNIDRWYCNSESGNCTWKVLPGYTGAYGLLVKKVRLMASNAGRTPLNWTLETLDPQGNVLEATPAAAVSWIDWEFEPGKTVKLAEFDVSGITRPSDTYRLSYSGNRVFQGTEIQFWGEESSQIVALPQDSECPYDGKGHLPGYELLLPRQADGVTVQYALAAEGPWSDEPPACIEVGSYTVFFKLSKAGWQDDIVSAKLTITEGFDITKRVRAAGGEGVSYAVEGSVKYSDAMAVDKAFNGIITANDSDRWFSADANTSGNCTWEILDGCTDSAQFVVKSVHVLATSPGRAPVNWKLEGIDADDSATVLTDVTGAQKTTDAEVEGKKVILIEIPVAERTIPYRKYRLSFSGNPLQATEIQFWGEEAHEIVAKTKDVVANYDGASHVPDFRVVFPAEELVTKKYALTETGPWSDEPPELVFPGTSRVYCQLSAEGFDTLQLSAAVTISMTVDLCAQARAAGAVNETYAVDGVTSSGNSPANAWDGQMNAGDTGRWHHGSADGWTTFTFLDAFRSGEPIYVSGLSWEMHKSAGSLPSRLPTSFTLLGSNDDAEWTVIKQFTGISWGDADLVDDVYVKRFDFAPVGSFRGYKVVDHCNPAYAGEIRLYGAVGKVVFATAEGWSGSYSGVGHLPKVTVGYPTDVPTVVEYAKKAEGPYSADFPPVVKGEKTIYCRVSAEGYASWYGSAVVATEDAVYGDDIEITELVRQTLPPEPEPFYTVDNDETDYYINGSTILSPANAFNGVWLRSNSADNDRWLRTAAVSAENPMTAIYRLGETFRAADKFYLSSYAVEIVQSVGRKAAAWTVYARNSEADEWVEVDSQTGVTWSDADIDSSITAATVYRKVFTLETPIRFRQVKFDLTGPSGGAALNEIRYYGKVEKVAKGLMLLLK